MKARPSVGVRESVWAAVPAVLLLPSSLLAQAAAPAAPKLEDGDGTNGVTGGVRGLFYGDASQLVAQMYGVLANVLWVGAATFVAWKITSALVGGSRVSMVVEDAGLDMPEVGVLAYPTETTEIAVPEAPRRKAAEAA